MTTITIPKELTKNKNLIAVPRDAYDEFLAWQRKIKSARTFKPTAADKKALAIARRNLARGKYIKWETLRHELGLDN